MKPPAEPPEPAEAGTTTNVTHGPVTESNGVAQAVLRVDIETNPPQEGQAFEVTVTSVGSGVALPPISGEFGSSGKAIVRTNVPADVTYAILVRVGQESMEQEIGVVAGTGSSACTF